MSLLRNDAISKTVQLTSSNILARPVMPCHLLTHAKQAYAGCMHLCEAASHSMYTTFHTVTLVVYIQQLSMQHADTLQ